MVGGLLSKAYLGCSLICFTKQINMAKLFDTLNFMNEQLGRDGCLEPEIVDSLCGYYVEICNVWGLSDEESANLLGVEVSQYQAIKDKQYEGGLSFDQIDRITRFYNLYNNMRIFISPRHARYWMTSNNKKFKGRRPVDVMIEGGLPKIKKITKWMRDICLSGM